MESKIYRIELDALDLGQLLDGLELRAVAWEKTSQYHLTGELPPDFIVDECIDGFEASRIASHYRSIISNIQAQRRAQNKS